MWVDARKHIHGHANRVNSQSFKCIPEINSIVKFENALPLNNVQKINMIGFNVILKKKN